MVAITVVLVILPLLIAHIALAVSDARALRHRLREFERYDKEDL